MSSLVMAMRRGRRAGIGQLELAYLQRRRVDSGDAR